MSDWMGTCGWANIHCKPAIEKPLVPPKSLGELCLETCQDGGLAATEGHKKIVSWRGRCPIPPLFIKRSDMIRLREVMWHRDRLGIGIAYWVWTPTYAQAFQFGRIVEKSKRP